MSAGPTSTEPAHKTIAVLGVGLIGGSIAAAVKKRGLAERVIGIGRSISRLEAAREAGLLDEVAASPEAARTADAVVVCTPVDRIAEDVRDVAALLKPGSIITDAGSVKGTICRAVRNTPLPEGIDFVGSHPLAGSQKSGWEHADPDLFQNHVCVITPDESDSSEAVSRVEEFWRMLGMRIVRMTPESHDRAIALTSHLPHVAAAALASLLTDAEQDLTATGFRDTTRIAAGDPDLWSAILLANADPVTHRIGHLIDRLQELQSAINTADADRLRSLLQQAREHRDALD